MIYYVKEPILNHWFECSKPLARIHRGYLTKVECRQIGGKLVSTVSQGLRKQNLRKLFDSEKRVLDLHFTSGLIIRCVDDLPFACEV